MDDIMIYFASKLSEYCSNRHCKGCPFENRTGIGSINCHIFRPAYWDLDEPLDFPNSN